MSKVLFIGGPGNISTSAVEEILARNNEVAIFTLPDSPDKGMKKKVKFYRGNRDNPGEVRAVVDDFRPELTVDVCCFTPKQARGLVSVLRGKVEKHVFVSTCDVYGYPLKRIPFRESDPFNKPVSQYATDKLACEKIFWAEHKAGSIPLAVVRPSYSFGPPFVLNFFSRFGGLELMSRLRAGKPVVVPGDGQTLIHPSSAYNTGRMIAEIALDPRTAGEGFTCGHDGYMTGDEYYRLFARALKVEPKLVHVPKELLLPLEAKLIPDDLLSELTQFHVAFSEEKFKSFFPEFVWKKSLDQAAREYVAFHDRQGDIPSFKKGYEDRIIAAWKACARSFKP
jgi:nucleoside-diphosphate-sugar epimerase